MSDNKLADLQGVLQHSPTKNPRKLEVQEEILCRTTQKAAVSSILCMFCPGAENLIKKIV